MNSNPWNNELKDWLEQANECTCEADDVDYCTCYREHNIADYFETLGLKGPSTTLIITGYILYWSDGRPYLTQDKKIACPIVFSKDCRKFSETALVVEVTGTKNEHGVIYATKAKVLARKPKPSKK